MPESTQVFCPQCARETDREGDHCPTCGAPLETTAVQRVRGTAFLLNEVRAGRFNDLVTAPQRQRIFDRYAEQLRQITGRDAPDRASAVRAPAASAIPAPAPVFATAGAAPATQTLSASARRPPPPPAPPRDWSWLAEQQANLFLFAGAFLVVVAALIYVGYSKQAVSGPLKMTLFVIYTLAFLGAGVVCLRYPRVAIAGRVFLAVGMLLVPLNFVAASNIFRDEKLNAQAMWLAGSLTTALFYSAVAGIGAGRNYALGAGAAVISATMAVIVIADVPVQWVPTCFLALALAIAGLDLVTPPVLRERLTRMWSLEAHAVAALSVVFAIFAALTFALPVSESDNPTRWYLPLTFGAALAYASVPLLAERRREAAVAALTMLAGVGLAVVYATHLPAEYYVVALAALAVAFGMVAFALEDLRLAHRLPREAREFAEDAGILASVAAVAVAAVVVVASADTEAARPFVLHTRWFITPSAALILAFCVVDASRCRRATAVLAGAGALVLLAASVVYGLDVSAQFYALALIAPAIVLAAAAVAPRPNALEALLPETWRDDVMLVARAAVPSGALVAVVMIAAVDARWIMTPAFAMALAFYALDAIGTRDRMAVAAFALATAGVCASIVYGLDASAEYYAFALVAPALLAVGAERSPVARRLDALLAPDWRSDLILLARASAMAGGVVASLAAVAGAQPHAGYHPDARAYLPIAFAAIAVFFALDASRERRADLSAALVASLVGVATGVVYATRLDAEYYGIAFVAMGFLFALGGRLWSPPWLDARTRDVAAAAAVTASWLAFEDVYAHAARAGALVHLSAALFYALAALGDCSPVTVGALLDVRGAERVRLAAGWLYAAGLTLTLGYVFLLRGLPGAPEEGEAGSLALPMMALALGFIVVALSTRWWRADFRVHLYVMSLLLALVSVVTPNTALVLASVLTAFIAAYAVAAFLEDEPLIAAPAVAFGFAAVPAWRLEFDAPLYVLPIAYSAIAIALWASGLALIRLVPRWSRALRAAGGVYALTAPAAGFAVLGAHTHGGLYGGGRFERSLPYEASTLAAGLVAALAIAEAAIWRRGWALVLGTAILTVSALLQIGRFHPGSVQPYTVVAGAYLVALGIFGLARLRLIPQAGDLAPWAEGAGAALIMGPSFLHSLDGGGWYQSVVLIEAAVFLTIGVSLRRRVLIAVALGFIVLVSARSLFDAIHALPNWIVIMIAGMALLGVGMGILLGRDRWSRWQDALVEWWREMDGAPAA